MDRVMATSCQTYPQSLGLYDEDLRDAGCRAVREFMGSCFRSQEFIWVMVSNIFFVHPYLGKIPILTNIFQRGWNHQLVMSQLELSIIGWFVWKVGRCVNFECVRIFGSMSGSIWFGSKWIRQCIELPSIQSRFDITIQSSKYQTWNANVSRAMSYIYLFDWLYLGIINIHDLILYNIPLFHANISFQVSRINKDSSALTFER